MIVEIYMPLWADIFTSCMPCHANPFLSRRVRWKFRLLCISHYWTFPDLGVLSSALCLFVVSPRTLKKEHIASQGEAKNSPSLVCCHTLLQNNVITFCFKKCKNRVVPQCSQRYLRVDIQILTRWRYFVLGLMNVNISKTFLSVILEIFGSKWVS